LYKWPNNKKAIEMKLILSALLAITTMVSNAQKATLYHPKADAAADIATATLQAKKEGKFVLIQAGGNWCTWCIEFERVTTTNASIDSTIKSAYIVYHLNYSPENMNKEAFAKLEFPQRFGFPSFIILDGDGHRMHTQNSEYLEDGKKSYDVNKVQAFLNMWSPNALKKEMYGM